MQLQRQKKKSVQKRTKVAPSHVKEQAAEMKPLIIVEQDFDQRYVPEGYVKLNLKTSKSQFIALVQAKTMFYLDSNNLDNGDVDEGLDALSDLYESIEEANNVWGNGTGITAGGVDLAVTVRSNYQTLLTNSLLVGLSDEQSGDQIRDADYDASEIERLCLDHSYVVDRMKGIAAVALGKTMDEVVEEDLADVLGFHNEEEIVQDINFREVADLDPRYGYERPSDRKHMICTGASYYYLKPELRDGEDGWEYNLRSGKRTRTEITSSNLKQIDDLTQEIEDYQREHGQDFSDHDANKTRMAINMKYRAGLDVCPVVDNGNNVNKEK